MPNFLFFFIYDPINYYYHPQLQIHFFFYQKTTLGCRRDNKFLVYGALAGKLGGLCKTIPFGLSVGNRMDLGGQLGLEGHLCAPRAPNLDFGGMGLQAPARGRREFWRVIVHAYNDGPVF